MADSKRLADWLLKNADVLDLRVTNFEWPSEWKMHGLFDIQVSIKLSDQNFVGRGTAKSEDLAFIKAGAEAIERAYCSYFNLHSTGVAAHVDESLAAVNAVGELFEREAFYCHFYTKTPFLPLSGQDIESEHQEVFKKIKNHNISLRFFRALTLDRLVILAIASGVGAAPAWGGIVGLASGENERDSKERALLECLRNITAVLHLGVKHNLTLGEFQKIQNPTAHDRQALALNPDFWINNEHLFPPTNSNEGLDSRQDLKWRPPIVTTLKNPFLELIGAPIFVCRAQGRHSDPLFRERDRSPITAKQLQEFMGNAFQAEILETTPSFLG